MRSQLACGKVSATCLVPHPPAGSDWSLVSVVAVTGIPRAIWRQNSWQKSLLRATRCRSHHSTGRQILSGRFAAISRNEAAELEQSGINGNLNEEAAVREEGLVSSVGTPAPLPTSFQDWYMADKQLVVMCFTAFATTGFMAILLAAAIPSLLAIKKAAQALENLADTAREELPGTMAAIRLSGMEISDLTMELNDLGQEISKGVKSSARALTAAETGMRQVGGLATNVSVPTVQVDALMSLDLEQAVVPVRAMQPLVARTARQMRESLVHTRSLLQNLLIVSRVSSWIGDRLQISLQGRTPILFVFSQKKGHKS